MFEKNLVVKNKTGLHARPAASLASLCGKFKSEIRIYTLLIYCRTRSVENHTRNRCCYCADWCVDYAVPLVPCVNITQKNTTFCIEHVRNGERFWSVLCKKRMLLYIQQEK